MWGQSQSLDWCFSLSVRHSVWLFGHTLAATADWESPYERFTATLSLKTDARLPAVSEYFHQLICISAHLRPMLEDKMDIQSFSPDLHLRHSHIKPVSVEPLLEAWLTLASCG